MWLDPANQNPHWSFVEFVCSYPDDAQLLQAQKEGWLDGDEFAIVSGLRETLLAYTPPGRDYYCHAAILEDPSWQAVIESAERTRERLLSRPISERERIALVEGSS
jgi:hypothetical protein